MMTVCARDVMPNPFIPEASIGEGNAAMMVRVDDWLEDAAKSLLENITTNATVASQDERRAFSLTISSLAMHTQPLFAVFSLF